MKTVIEMACEAGIIHPEKVDAILNRFAELVRADDRNRTWTQDHWTEYERSIAAQEREACAKVCESLAGQQWVTREGALECSDAIRARGSNT